MIRLREDSRNPAHLQVSVFVGRNEGSLGHAGQITLRVDEWDDLVDDYRNQRSGWVVGILPPLTSAGEELEGEPR